MTPSPWPDLSAADLAPTLETLHLWSQIPGKVKLATQPWLNESWHVPLQLYGRGLTTGLLPYGGSAFELAFDVLDGRLRLTTSDGGEDGVALEPMSVAAFYAAATGMLSRAGIDVDLWAHPCEMEGAEAFTEDTAPRTFDLAVARTYWRALIQVQRVFQRFRSRFTGKCSPIHFFWGSFDLAVTRFSGRPAPLVTRGGPGMPLPVAQDAYADEQASCGFWPGGAKGVEGPAFYVEAWPAPEGFATARMAPPEARFMEAMDEWVLDYAAVRGSDDPDATLLAFLQSGYEAIADPGRWPRSTLERGEGPVGEPPEPIRADAATEQEKTP